MSILNTLTTYLDDGYVLHGSPNIGIKVLEPRSATYREDKLFGLYATDQLTTAVGCAIIAKRCYAHCITSIDNPLFFESMGIGCVYVCPPKTFVRYENMFVSRVSVAWVQAYIIHPAQDEIFSMLFGVNRSQLLLRNAPAHN